MSRPIGSKNKIDDEKAVDNSENQNVVEEKKETEPEFVSVFEAAARLKTTEPTIKLWVDHGHLVARNGNISIRSIRECRFNTRRMI